MQMWRFSRIFALFANFLIILFCGYGQAKCVDVLSTSFCVLPAAFFYSKLWLKEAASLLQYIFMSCSFRRCPACVRFGLKSYILKP